MNRSSDTEALRGRAAVVAGTTRGAGRGIAAALGEACATVICTGRTTRTRRSEYDRTETIEKTAELVTHLGGVGIAAEVDHLEQIRCGPWPNRSATSTAILTSWSPTSDAGDNSRVRSGTARAQRRGGICAAPARHSTTWRGSKPLAGRMLVRAGERVCYAADQENIQAALRWLLTYRLAEVADVRADLPHEGRYVRVRPVLDQLPVGHAMHCNPRDRDDLAGRLVAQTFPNPRGARRHPSHHLVTLGDQVVDGMHRVEER